MIKKIKLCSIIFTVLSIFYLQAKQTIIVFIHGTIFPGESRAENPQPISDLGLVKIEPSMNNINAKNCTQWVSLYKSVYETTIESPDETNFHFYTFGWPGKLKAKERERQAVVLYCSLLWAKEKIWEKTEDTDIEITLLTHSHGGNIVLNLAKIEDKLKQNLNINKLIAVAAPIQEENCHLIKHKMFKTIFLLFSSWDLGQLFAPQFFNPNKWNGWKPSRILSKRCFEENLDKLFQIKVKIDNFRPTHNEFWELGFGAKSNYSLIYRKNFPIYPLPIAILAPKIMHSIESNDNKKQNMFLHIKTDSDSDALNFEFYDYQDHMHKENSIRHNLKTLFYDPDKELELLFSQNFTNFDILKNPLKITLYGLFYEAHIPI